MTNQDTVIPTIKAVCVIYHDYHIRKSDRQLIPHIQTLVRVVYALEKIQDYDGLPFKFYDNASHQWAEDKTWSLWSGEIKFQGETLAVNGWTFDGEPPQYWGGTLIAPRHYATADRIAMWGWLGQADFPPDRYIKPHQTTAARKITKYLKG